MKMTTRPITMFLSGMAFALAAMLSCTNHGPVTADMNGADASVGSGTDGPATLPRMVSADNDAAQWRTSVIRLPSSSSANGTLLTGPFMVTTLLQNTKSLTGGVAMVEFYFAPGACADNLDVRQTFLSLTNSPAGTREFSGRLWVPPLVSLCYVSSTNEPLDDLNFSFSGFVPY